MVSEDRSKKRREDKQGISLNKGGDESVSKKYRDRKLEVYR